MSNIKENNGFHRDKVIGTIKEQAKDRGLSAAKDEFISNALTNTAVGLNTLIGIRKGLKGRSWKGLNSAQKSSLLKKSVLKRGIPTMAVAGITTDTMVPAVRLRNMHKKELGTEPTASDYAKLMATKGLPSAAYYGAMLKNKKKLVDGTTKAIQNIPKLVAGGVSGKDRKKAFKAVAAGVGAGGALGILDDVAGTAQLIHTPETIIKAKKKALKGDGRMELKEAFEIIDCMFEKESSYEEDASLKLAGEIIDYGFDKIAKNQSLLKEVGNVLTGKNIKKSKALMSATNVGRNTLGAVNGLTSAVGQELGNIAKSSQNSAKNVARSAGARVDKAGNIVKTKFSNLDKDTLAKLIDAEKKVAGGKSKAIHQTNSAMADIQKQLVGQKKPAQSDRAGIFGKAENVIRHGQYSKNKAYNEKIDGIVDRMKTGKTISNKELGTTKTTLFGKKKTIGNTDFTNELKRYNTLAGEVGKAAKEQGKSKAKIGDLKHELNAKNIGETYEKKMNKAKGAQAASDGISSARNIIGSMQAAMNNINGGSISGDIANKAQQKYNKEVAKTVGAYGALGTGLYAGAKALGKKDEKQNPVGSYSPQYNYN